MLLLLLIGGGETTPIPPVDDSAYRGDTYLYDALSGTGSVSGGSVQPGPNQNSPTGSVTGGTILAPDTIYD